VVILLTNSPNICFSGGAAGADYLFGECAALCSHKVMHFSFKGHKAKSKTNVYPIADEDLLQADKYLLEANKLLKRTFPTDSHYVNNMLRRNFFQIKATEKVYAVTYMDIKTGLPLGGTAWAVLMAAQRGVKEIYLYDQKDYRWWSADGVTDIGIDWIYETEVPSPSGYYTGIGSTDLSSDGEEAIVKLYEECEYI
jgi:hypothetical protein